MDQTTSHPLLPRTRQPLYLSVDGFYDDETSWFDGSLEDNEDE